MNNKKVLIIGIAYISVIVLIVAGAFAFKQYREPVKQVKIPQTIDLSKSPEAIETAIIQPKYFAQNYPLNISGSVYSLKISGDVILENGQSINRVILVDKNKKEYLVAESYLLLTGGKNTSINQVCLETCALPGIVPDYLRMEGHNASFKVTKVDYLDGAAIAKLNKTPEKITAEVKQAQVEQKQAEVKELNKQIKNEGLNWTAGETSVSELSYEEKKTMFGIFAEDGVTKVLPDLQGFEYYTGGVFTLNDEPSDESKVMGVTASSLPASWDWRNAYGKNWMTSVKNQGQCGSCWAFAGVSAIEAGFNLYYNQNLNLDLSEQDVVSRYPGSCQGGGYSYNVLRAAISYGITDEACMPYQATDSNPGSCSDRASRLWGLTWYSGTQSSDEALKRALITYGPLTMSIPSWWHVITLVGYETAADGSAVWIIKNSWGTNWGESGYAKMSLPTANRAGLNSPGAPFFKSNPSAYQIKCEDNDHDGYCFWGIYSATSTCPATCSPIKDCNDSNPNLAVYDNNFNCLPPPSPTPSPIPTSTPTPSPTPTFTPTPTPSVLGDINIDGKVNLSDMSWLMKDWRKEASQSASADLNHDGVINTLDFISLKNILKNLGIIKVKQ